mmetsp:Transcript_10682/g.26986  ORF Transcript_10682/g.26986 Transcript_10682/m.26986 type:complete len:333 (+) Transcript_10682:314-1312(+)
MCVVSAVASSEVSFAATCLLRLSLCIFICSRSASLLPGAGGVSGMSGGAWATGFSGFGIRIVFFGEGEPFASVFGSPDSRYSLGLFPVTLNVLFTDGDSFAAATAVATAIPAKATPPTTTKFGPKIFDKPLSVISDGLLSPNSISDTAGTLGMKSFHCASCCFSDSRAAAASFSLALSCSCAFCSSFIFSKASLSAAILSLFACSSSASFVDLAACSALSFSKASLSAAILSAFSFSAAAAASSAAFFSAPCFASRAFCSSAAFFSASILAASDAFASASEACWAISGACANFCSSLASTAFCSSAAFLACIFDNGFICFCLVSAFLISLSR